MAERKVVSVFWERDHQRTVCTDHRFEGGPAGWLELTAEDGMIIVYRWETLRGFTVREYRGEADPIHDEPGGKRWSEMMRKLQGPYTDD